MNEDELLETTRVEENEIARADDLEFAFKSIFGNISKYTKALSSLNTDFIIGGALKKESVTRENKWNFRIEPLIGYCANKDQIVVNGNSHVLTIAASENANRIDNVYVRGKLYDSGDGVETTRAFKEDSAIITKSIKIRHVLNAEYSVVRGNTGVNTARPKNDDDKNDWIKIAEIFIPAGAENINECYLYSVSKDLSNSTNDNWTNNIDDTMKLYNLLEFQNIFRMVHEKDGNLKKDIILKSNLKKGVGSDDINLTSFVLGASMYGSDARSFGATSTLTQLINKIRADIDSKSDSGHTHSSLKNGGYTSSAPSKTGTLALTSDIPSSLPASDVYSWAKAANKPTYSWDEIQSKPSSFSPSKHSHGYSDLSGVAPSSHSHKFSDITSLPIKICYGEKTDATIAFRIQNISEPCLLIYNAPSDDRIAQKCIYGSQLYRLYAYDLLNQEKGWLSEIQTNIYKLPDDNRIPVTGLFIIVMPCCSNIYFEK